MARRKKPPISLIRLTAVMRHFANDSRAIEIAMEKPRRLYAENNSDSIIEMIEKEIKVRK